MFYSSLLLTFVGLMAFFTSAAPVVEVAKRDTVRRHTNHHYPFMPSGHGHGTGTGYYPTGTGTGWPRPTGWPTGTGTGYPRPTGYGLPSSSLAPSSSSSTVAPASTSSSAAVSESCSPTSSSSPSATITAFKPLKTSDSCPIDGVVVCNGERQYGLCNFGHVVFQAVAAGTSCKEGKIVFTGHTTRSLFNA